MCGCLPRLPGTFLDIADFRNSFASRSEDSVRVNSFQFRAVAAQSSVGVVAARDESPDSVLGARTGAPSIFPIIPPSAGPVRRFLHTTTAQDHRVSLPCQREQRAHRHPHALPACPGVGVGLQPAPPYYTRASRVLLAAVRAGKAAVLGPAALLARTMSFVPPAKRHPHALPACPGVGVGLQPAPPYYTRASRVLLAAVRAELCASSKFLHVPHTNGALYFSGYALLPCAWCGAGSTAGSSSLLIHLVRSAWDWLAD